MALIPSFIPGGDRINQAVTNFLEGGQVGIDSIRRVNYGSSFLWTIDFIETNNLKAPAPFDSFFPASDVTLNFGTLNSHTYELAHTSLSFPRNSAFKTIDVTFYDDETRALQKWMSDWINLDILNDGQFVSGVNDNHAAVRADSFGAQRAVQPLRQMKFALLDRERGEALQYNYLVYPDGQIDFQGTQGSDASQFQVRFVLYQELGKPKSADTGIFRDVVRQLGRFVGRFV